MVEPSSVAVVTVSASTPVQRPLLEGMHRLLVATAGRPPQLGCFGMHEWAMVYRPAGRRPARDWPLRLGSGGTDEVVESHRIACSHFDAFRFFTEDGPAAQPRSSPAATTGPSSSSRAACTPAWTSTSTRSG